MSSLPLFFAQISPSTSVDDVTNSGIVQLIANITFFFGVILALAGVAMVILKLVNGKVGDAVKTGLGVLVAAALLMNLPWALSLLGIVTDFIGVALDSVGGLFGGSGGAAGPVGAEPLGN